MSQAQIKRFEMMAANALEAHGYETRHMQQNPGIFSAAFLEASRPREPRPTPASASTLWMASKYAF
ncbi:MAG: hypothetical protein GKR94_12405 [Gammaproteobacteria bacterium]|nr:hypothetical protein [Gammaproteobacteria bacterium]